MSISDSGGQVRNVVLAVTGASGSCYARKFMERAASIEGAALSVVFTDTAREVWKHELGCEAPDSPEKVLTCSRKQPQFAAGIMLLDNHSFCSPFCSGSAAADVMVVLPCSMGTLARIAAGTADDAVARMADVQLKERRPLILVPRETPLSLIHLRNMTTLTEAGAIIAPAAPGFYSRPADLDALIDGFVSRILHLAGLAPLDTAYRWNP